MKKLFRVLALAGSGLLLLAPATAIGQKAEMKSAGGEMGALRAEVEALKARLANLEAVGPTFATFMPAFSERFHVMHLAGDAGDWQLVSHEFTELERLMEVAEVIDPEKGKLMKGFMGGNMKALETAMEDGDREKFSEAVKQTVVSCNLCHTAVGNPFIKVTLDPADGLNMRHPHDLGKSIFDADKAKEH